MRFGHTPESILPRSDSRNPATTCRGITSTGRPCRRALAQPTARADPNPSPSHGSGVLAVLESGISAGDSAAAFYCWQHKDQAEHLAADEHQRTKFVSLKERTSVDTLVDRIGVMNLDDEVDQQKKQYHRSRRKDEPPLKNRDTLPSGWHDMQSPLMTVPEEILPARQKPTQPPRTNGSNVKASFLCCIQADTDDLPAPRRHRQPPNGRPRPSRPAQQRSGQLPMRNSGRIGRELPMTEVHTISPQMQRKEGTSPAYSPPGELPYYAQPPRLDSSRRPQTQSLLNLIPAHLTPATTALLLAELSKPISPADETGYIYVFWLTPEEQHSRPDDETASSLLEPFTDTSPNAARQARRQSEALRRYASTHRSSAETRTILLKIGRAANVHRRLSQWTKQCGNNITLIRYYPYVPNQARSEPLLTPLKVPHVHRVERLIHIELAEKRITDQGPCDSCGREHREWFEVPATREGLRTVDEVVRRWVDWGEGY